MCRIWSGAQLTRHAQGIQDPGQQAFSWGHSSSSPEPPCPISRSGFKEHQALPQQMAVRTGSPPLPPPSQSGQAIYCTGCTVYCNPGEVRPGHLMPGADGRKPLAAIARESSGVNTGRIWILEGCQPGLMQGWEEEVEQEGGAARLYITPGKLLLQEVWRLTNR